MRLTGTVLLKQFDKYIDWYSKLSCDEADALFQKYVEWAKGRRSERKLTQQESVAIEALEGAMREQLQVVRWASYPPEETKENKWPKTKEAGARRMRGLQSFATDFEQPVRVSLWANGNYALIYIGNPMKGIAVIEPEKYLDYVPEKDYTALTPADVRTALNAPHGVFPQTLVPRETEGLTVQEAKANLDKQEEKLNTLLSEMEQARRYKHPELAELKAKLDVLQKELESKRQDLMEELDKRLEEMEEKKFQLEGQIYLLDSQIYSILCYAGETVKFAQLRKGKAASVEEPIIIHQKLRFLDEELGRLASLYYIEWEELNMFETFLQHHPQALETFAPNERCVVLVRLSRNNAQLWMDNREAYQNMLRDYQYYHGSTIGIVIRNGENLFLGWTEESRVHIEDDLIISQVVTEVKPAEERSFTFESDRKKYIKEQRQEKKRAIDGIVSRSFIYSILQGIVDNTSMLPLPEGIKLNKQSPYVVYAVADRWLSDSRYGSFNDIIAKANEVVKEGDFVLATQRLFPERPYGGYVGQAWHNARGIGEKNRTHDCSVDDCAIYPVNMVQYGDPEVIVTFKWKNALGEEHISSATGESVEAVMRSRVSGAEFISSKEFRSRRVLVSLQKKGWSFTTYERTTARANFELREHEFINLSNLNSVVLEWVITNRSLGKWCVGGKEVDYAFAIRYLNHAMEFVRKREAEDKRTIDAVDPTITTDPDWPLYLTDWKIKTGVRNITERNAKRFSKYVRSGRESVAGNG